MRSNSFDNMIFGFNTNAQGIANVVGRTHRMTLRTLKSARRLTLRGSWCAIKRALAGSLAIRISEMTPAPATCPSYTGTRFQRHQRWMSGVVVDPGTVGVC